MGHTVELAQDGQMAIEIYKTAELQNRSFDVVILDLTIREGMGGLETRGKLLRIDPGVKAIAMAVRLRVIAPLLSRMLHLKWLAINIVAGVAGFSTISSFKPRIAARFTLTGPVQSSK
jgi:CheY-like chemotaxis protein